MNAQFAAMHTEHASMRADMNAQHADIREPLHSLDRRTARIEGRLFGIEISPEPADGE